MIPEDKKINRGRFLLLFFSITVLISSCSVLDPVSLTIENDRQKIIDEIIIRGRVYSVKDDDEQAMISLLDESDPQVRLAAVMLMEHNLSEEVFNALIRAVQDDDEMVSQEAIRVILENWDESYKAVKRGLSSRQSGIVYTSIELIHRNGSREASSYLLMLFSDPRENVRGRASRVYVMHNEYENPEFQTLLNSTDPLVRQTAVETLGRFKNPQIIPAILQYILDPEADIRKAAIFSISEFDKDALPSLHETMRIDVKKELKLSVLELIDGILEEESIPLLVSLLSDNDRLIAAKSAEILYRQGPVSIPEILRNLETTNEGACLLSFDLLRRYGLSSSLEAVIPFLLDERVEVAKSADETIRFYDQEAFPYLLTALDESEAELQKAVLFILLDQRASELVYEQSSKSYPVDRVFLLFESASQEEVLLYLDEVELPSRVKQALKNLYDIELHTTSYQKIRRSGNRDVTPYLYFYREWEDTLISAELSRQASFTYMHQFFESGEELWLTESKQLRETALLFDRSALAFRDSALRSGLSASNYDISLVADYLASRKELTESWRALTSDIQDLAMLIFLRHSLDIESVMRDYDFFRTLPRDSTPVPANL